MAVYRKCVLYIKFAVLIVLDGTSQARHRNGYIVGDDICDG